MNELLGRKEMDSVVIETLGCPLDPDLLKSCEQFNSERSHSQTSNHSQSDDEGIVIKHADLIEQFNSLSFDDVPVYKNEDSKCSNKIIDINSEKKSNSENDKIEKNQSSFLLANKKLLTFFVESDVKSTFCKYSHKNCDINSKKNNAEKLSYVENMENIENQLSSLSLKNNKVLNNCKNDFAKDESNSDEEVECLVTLRERDPTRRNRFKNNKQCRPTPFSQKQVKTSQSHLNSNDYQSSGNFSPQLLHASDTSHDGSDSLYHINSTDFERNGIIYPSSRTFCTSDPVINEAFQGMVSSTVTPFNNGATVSFIPYTAANKIDDGVVPSLVDDIGNINYELSAEINDLLYFDNFGSVTAEEVDNYLKNYTDSKSVDFSCTNHESLTEESTLDILINKETEKVLKDPSRLNQNISVVSTNEKTSYPKNNQRNRYLEPSHKDSFFSQVTVKDTSFFSNLNEENNNLKKSSKFYNTEYFRPGNCSNLVHQNVTSISNESLSPKELDFIILSNEIEQKIANLMNESKQKTYNPSHASTYKTENTEIRCKLGTAAKEKLFNSSSFCKIKWEFENEKLRQQIKSGMLGTEEKKVIYVLKKNRNTKYRGTNLHYAIRSENIEKVFCLVECHKECHDSINFEINLVDSDNKAVLNYSKEKGMDLLSDYLEENLAKEWISV